MPDKDDLMGLIERAWQLEARQIALSTALELASRKLAFYESYAGTLDKAAGALESILRPTSGTNGPVLSSAPIQQEHRLEGTQAGTQTSSPTVGPRLSAMSPAAVDLGQTLTPQANGRTAGSPEKKPSVQGADRSSAEAPSSTVAVLPQEATPQSAVDGAAVRAIVDRAVSDERLRLAQRIHDGLTQEVTSLVLGLEATQRDLAKDSAAAGEGLARARQSARSCLSEARRFLVELRSEPPVATGLVIALQRLVEEFRQEEGLPVSFQWSGPYPSVCRDVEHAVLGVVQEALTNARKHSQAETIVVSFRFAADVIEGMVFDDGQGFDPVQAENAARRGDSFGIVCMRQRMEALGGMLCLDSTPGKGARVELQVPLGQGTPCTLR